MKGKAEVRNETYLQVGSPGSWLWRDLNSEVLLGNAVSIYSPESKHGRRWAERPGSLNRGLGDSHGSSGAERALEALGFHAHWMPVVLEKWVWIKERWLFWAEGKSERSSIKSCWQPTLSVAEGRGLQSQRGLWVIHLLYSHTKIPKPTGQDRTCLPKQPLKYQDVLKYPSVERCMFFTY